MKAETLQYCARNNISTWLLWRLNLKGWEVQEVLGQGFAQYTI